MAFLAALRSVLYPDRASPQHRRMYNATLERPLWRQAGVFQQTIMGPHEPGANARRYLHGQTHCFTARGCARAVEVRSDDVRYASSRWGWLG